MEHAARLLAAASSLRRTGAGPSLILAPSPEARDLLELRHIHDRQKTFGDV
jgi:hypothetical protein